MTGKRKKHRGGHGDKGQMQEAREGKSRNVPAASKCPICKREFWSPKGLIVCPWCGKRIEVSPGVDGSMPGFFKKLIEGIAISGGVLRVEVHNPCLGHPRRSQGLTDACVKVIPETPHQERAAEGQNVPSEVSSRPEVTGRSRKGETG